MFDRGLIGLPGFGTGRKGHFDTSWDCNRHKRQYEASFADLVDCHRVATRPELARLPFALAIETSRPLPIFDFVCRPLLEDEIEINSSRLLLF